ncbi:MAG: thiamine diphosphokinase [Dehalococcoidia bacterium]|nr:thiamine diphosphokinase [Dehalococcoidia bacterium]
MASAVRHALVVADGDIPSPSLLAGLAKRAGLVVAADGGAAKALRAGLVVDAVVGDLDSLTEAVRRSIPEQNIHKSFDLNSTDLQKAIEYCLAWGATRIDVTAAGGGRADHALANLSVIPLYRGQADVRVVDDLFEIRLVDGTIEIEAPVGTVVSLVAIGRCEGVTTTGLRWDLTEHTLPFSPRGVHNEVERHPATVAVRNGDLLLFQGRWIEPHAGR